MRPLPLAAALAFLAGPAMADCTALMSSFEARHGNVLEPSSGIDKPVAGALRDMRDAALTLDEAGHGASCQIVVNAMGDVIDETPAVAEAEIVTQPDIADLVLASTAWDALTWNDVRGMSVFNYDDVLLGEVRGRISEDSSSPTHLIVAHGGFWDIYAREAAIPLSKLRFDETRRDLYVDMTPAELDQAPDYDREDGGWTRDRNDRYFEAVN